MARGTYGCCTCITRVIVAPMQEWSIRVLSAYTKAVISNIQEYISRLMGHFRLSFYVLLRTIDCVRTYWGNGMISRVRLNQNATCLCHASPTSFMIQSSCLALYAITFQNRNKKHSGFCIYNATPSQIIHKTASNKSINTFTVSTIWRRNLSLQYPTSFTWQFPAIR